MKCFRVSIFAGGWVVAWFLGGCATLRDNDGVAHDAAYNADQAQRMVQNAPGLVPFVPPALVAFAVKAALENGEIRVAGRVVDEDGRDLSGVTLTIQRADLVSFDLSNDAPIFAERTMVDHCGENGTFRLDKVGVHTVKLTFSKEGFESRAYHVEIVREKYQWDVAAAKAEVITGASPLVQEELKVTLRKATASGNGS